MERGSQMKSPVEKLIEYIDTHCPEKKLSMSDRDYYLFAEKLEQQMYYNQGYKKGRDHGKENDSTADHS